MLTVLFVPLLAASLVVAEVPSSCTIDDFAGAWEIKALRKHGAPANFTCSFDVARDGKISSASCRRKGHAAYSVKGRFSMAGGGVVQGALIAEHRYHFNVAATVLPCGGKSSRRRVSGTVRPSHGIWRPEYPFSGKRLGPAA